MSPLPKTTAAQAEHERKQAEGTVSPALFCRLLAGESSAAVRLYKRPKAAVDGNKF